MATPRFTNTATAPTSAKQAATPSLCPPGPGDTQAIPGALMAYRSPAPARPPRPIPPKQPRRPAESASTRSRAASGSTVLPSAVFLAAPLVAALLRPPHVHNLDGQVASRAEHPLPHRPPVQQTPPVRAAARPDHGLAGAGLASGLDQRPSSPPGPALPH